MSDSKQKRSPNQAIPSPSRMILSSVSNTAWTSPSSSIASSKRQFQGDFLSFPRAGLTASNKRIFWILWSGAILFAGSTIAYTLVWALRFLARGSSTPSSLVRSSYSHPIRSISPVQRKQPEVSRVIQRTSHAVHQVISSKDRHEFVQTFAKRCEVDLAQYNNLPPAMQFQVWKFCSLSLGVANIYHDMDELTWFLDYSDLFASGGNSNKQHRAIVIVSDDGAIHEAFLHLPQRHVSQEMIQELMKYSKEKCPRKGDHKEASVITSQLLSNVLKESLDPSSLVRLKITCPLLMSNRSTCALMEGYCCQVQNANGDFVAALRSPTSKPPTTVITSSLTTSNPIDDDDDPFIATVTVTKTGNPPATLAETPNMFDILFQNQCLPTQKQCHACLRKSTAGCSECREACPCYCQVLCTVRPPPKVLVEVWNVRPPPHALHPQRLIPRKVHQTWFEPVTKEKYPNMSRLINSWVQSGWSYTFYDDDKAAHFLQKHFPPQVFEAYDVLLPGAFKADLFRYCVLLIEGGVYADMDVLLESNLDLAFPNDVGFMVPIDEPGIKVGHRSCLWNGLLAVAPGHPFLAHTIEIVVNQIRNRFTSVDYDDMLCPNPVLSVSHTVDTLFTCGPCILGAAMNQVLGRHPQEEWNLGDINLWATGTAPSRGANDIRHEFPGRSIILSQNKNDMGAHRFTWAEENMIIASTDLKDYDDRPPTKQHYSKTHEKVGVYGLRNLYKDNVKANENIKIVVQGKK